MNRILRLVGSLAGLLLLGVLAAVLVLNLRERQPNVSLGSGVFQSPIKQPTSTPVPPKPGTPTPDPADIAICARYPTPPYPINLTPCPYYLTPPAQPIEIFTPQPLPIPILPTLIAGQRITTVSGSTFRPLYISQSYKEGEVCDFRIAPDGQKAALTICNSEGYTMVLIVNVARGTGFRIGIIDVSSGRPYNKATWFRGWFPDSRHVLLMSDWLEILNIETGEHRRVTPENAETATDAAVSPDGRMIIYTRIQGDVLKIIDTDGNMLRSISSPSPKPGDRPENLTWSPDGKWIAYTWDQGTSYYPGPLWLIEASSGQMKPLSPSDVYDLSPRWSPDSATLLVVRRENIKDSAVDSDPTRWISDLWVVSISENAWKQLTRLEGKSAWAPNWTLDGSAIVFMSSQGSQPGTWTINVDGTGLQQHTTDKAISPLNLVIVPEVIP